MENKSNIIKRILDILQSKELIVISILIASVLLGYIYSYGFVTPKYKTSSTLLLIPNNENEKITSSDLNLNSELISTYSNIAKQPKILKQVIQNLNLDMTEGELLENLKISNIAGTYIIEITVESVMPEEAMDIANEVSKVFLNEIKEIYNLENIGIIDKAELPIHPYNINHIKDILLFLIAGMLVVCLIIVIRYLFDNTVKTEEDIEDYIELKTLGKIPLNTNKAKELIDRSNAKSYVLECINTIRTNILYMTAIKTARTILITSSRAQEGKSFISSNIAAAFADIDKKVLLIDADMRKGRTDKIFDVNNLYGLSDYLCAMTGNIKEDLELGKKYVIESEIPNLHILTNGTTPPNPAELLSSNNMEKLINMLKRVYDIIIIDAPPCMPVSDSIILSTIADATILTVNSEKTKIKELIEVKKRIEIVGGNVIGAILNKVRLTERAYNQGYYYYGNGEKEENDRAQRKIITAGKIFKQAINELDKNKEVFPQSEEKSEEIVKDEQENVTDKILTKDEIQKIIKEEIAKINYTEEFKKINEIQINYEKEVENLKNIQYINLNQTVSAVSEVRENLKSVSDELNEKVENNLNLINVIIGNSKKTIDEIQAIVREEISKINYMNEFNKINETIQNLQNSYLEIINKENEREEEEQQVTQNKKIIDINFLKRQKQKKKKVYSIKEDIYSVDLEKTAFCIIPFEKKETNIAL